MDDKMKCQGAYSNLSSDAMFNFTFSGKFPVPSDISNLTFYREDWYTYCYNYYDGQFYDYYETKYETKVNGTKTYLEKYYNIHPNNTKMYNKVAMDSHFADILGIPMTTSVSNGGNST
jgi:hypothetical protein